MWWRHIYYCGWFLTNETQALQHWQKKCMDCTGSLLKNTLITLYESILVSLLTFQPTLICNIKYSWGSISLNKFKLYFFFFLRKKFNFFINILALKRFYFTFEWKIFSSLENIIFQNSFELISWIENKTIVWLYLQIDVLQEFILCGWAYLLIEATCTLSRLSNCFSGGCGESLWHNS